MISFEREFFKKFHFTKGEIRRFYDNALHDLEIARKDPFPEVCFSYGYQALIKAGIALIAETGGVKVRSLPGHHAKILAKMSAILKDPDVLTIGNAMRTKRNTDLYGGGRPMGKKEADDYFKFAKGIVEKIGKSLGAS